MMTMIFTGCKNEEKRLAIAYTDMFEAEKAYISYSTEYEMENLKINQIEKIAIDGDNSSIDITVDMPLLLPDTKVKVILKDKILYMIDYTSQQVITMDLTDEYDEVVAKIENNPNYMIGVGTDELTFVQSGNEDFKGESLYFEEYTIPLGTYKYYFKEKQLVGMSIISDKLTEPLEVTIDEISENYPEEAFTIPKDFTKVSAEEAGFEFDIDQLFP